MNDRNKRVLAVVAFVCLAASSWALQDLRRDEEAISAQLSRRAETLVANLVMGRPSRAREEMARPLATALNNDAVERLFGDMHRQGGGYHDAEPAVISQGPEGSVIAVVPLHYAERSYAARVTFERAGPLAKVIGFSVQPWHGPRPSDRPRDAGGGIVAPPPSYADGALFKERTLDLGGPECVLKAVLTCPLAVSKDRPAPGALLITGDGTGDLNGSEGGVLAMRDLAQGLAARGIVTLRYEQRGFACPSEEEPYGVDEVVIEDAVAAYRLLLSQPEADPKRLAVAGMGMGAWLAPEAAERAGASRVVLLSPPGADPLRSLVERHRRAATQVPQAERDQWLAVADQLARAAAGDIATGEIVAGHPGRYWLGLLERDPVGALARGPRPFLALFGRGGGEWTVAERESWRPALHNHELDSAIREVGGRETLITPNPRGSDIPGNLSEDAVDAVAAFILRGVTG